MSFFGGKDPFDDPFFTQPFGGKNPFDEPYFGYPFGSKADSEHRRKEISIEELDSDENSQKHAVTGKDPIITLPEKNTNGASFCFRRVAYGGLEGMYYSSSMASGSCGDGVVLVECKEEDKTIGQALHTISKGIRNKGHSVTTQHNSDGGMDKMQTLHNLNEDELTGFEEDWKSNVRRYFPGWNDNFSLLEYAEAGTGGWNGQAKWGGWALPSAEQSGWALPSAEHAGNEESSTKERAKKIVPVNIE